MSRVYFHSPSGDAELRGSERAWGASLVEDIAVGIVTPHWSEGVDRMLELVPRDHYLHAGPEGIGWMPRWETSFRTAWRVQLDLDWRGHRLDSWTFSLNTALALGNDQVKLLARIHAQCEIHGWVEGPHRGWLADLIEQGRALGFYRPDAGWEDCRGLLRRRDDEPVVMSYSVCDPFPNAYASDWMPPWPDGVPLRFDVLPDDEQRLREERADAWYELPVAEQWDRGMRWLRGQPGARELKPDDWAEFRFGHGLTVFDLIALDRDDRLDRALAVPADVPVS